jgi:hypothetical protein
MAHQDAIEFLKKTTAELISFEPTLIALTHAPVLVSNGRGGLTLSGAAVTETTPKNRFFSQTTPKESVTIKSEGKEIVVDWVLIGLVDDDIREGDTFVVGGVSYKVWNVHDDQRWQKKGLVTRA